jgi:uncharacterized protein YcnI
MRNKIIPALLLASVAPGFAHVSLTETWAKPGAQYVAHFRVGHGCEGSPTTQLKVVIPDGVSGVAPQPVPGWTIEMAHSGARISAVTWKGGSLATSTPHEFAVTMTLPATAGTLAFPTTQTCEKGSESWSELPATDGHKLKNPVPLLTVSPTPPAKAMPDDSMPGMKM